MSDVREVPIAVAILTLPGPQVLLVWNDHWKGFTFPMTKVRFGPPQETPEHAALRAAAEVLRFPVRIVTDQPSLPFRKFWRSEHKDALSGYRYTLVPVEVHPDFREAALASRPVFVDLAKLEAGEYQPLTASVGHILEGARAEGWLP